MGKEISGKNKNLGKEIEIYYMVMAVWIIPHGISIERSFDGAVIWNPIKLNKSFVSLD